MSDLSWLRPSAITDLAQLITFVRPAVRTQVVGRPVEGVQRFAWQLGCFAACDPDGFVVFSRSQMLSSRILSLDRRQGDHTYALGRLLGYPHCCCRAAAGVGECELDAWAAKIASCTFIGRYKMIDNSGYQKGRSLVSHIPCSPHCVPSRRMAIALQAGLRATPPKISSTAGTIIRILRDSLRRELGDGWELLR